MRSWICRPPALGAALEERVAVGVEQHAVAGGHRRLASLRAVVDHAEQDEQLGPGAVALVHRVRVAGVVLAQALVQSRERVVAQERLVLREHVALLGVEQEHEPEDHGQQRPVDLVGVLGERCAQQLAAGGVVGGLEAAQQLVQRVQHLLGELLADLVLELAAALQERRQPFRARPGEQRVLPEQQAQRGADRPARGLDHVGDLEVEPARALAARRRDEPQRVAVEEEPSGDGAVAQQPLHPSVPLASSLSRPPGGLSKSTAGSSTRTSSCQGGAPSAGSSSRTARSGRRVSP